MKPKEFDVEKWQEEWKGYMLDCAEDASKHLLELLMDMLAHSRVPLDDTLLKALGINDDQIREFSIELGEKLLDEHFRQKVYGVSRAKIDSMRRK